ncbi:hypothetical protein TNCV_4751341 [Trichonephila clavipes]|nr:hypothetical protein TNCV_4751341 [Trichonephila clavipes]
MSSPGFEPRPYGTTVSVANRCAEVVQWLVTLTDVRLEKGEEGREHPTAFTLKVVGGTESKRTFTCIELKATAYI